MDHQAVAQLLGNYGEFVGAIAVVATLIYLAVQIRQNSLQIKLNSFQNASEKYNELIVDVLQPSKFEMFREGLQSYSSLNPDKQALFHAHMTGVLTVYSNNRQLFKAGTIPEGLLISSREDLARILKCPGAREWWESLRLESRNQARMATRFEEIVSNSDVGPLNQVLPFLKLQ